MIHMQSLFFCVRRKTITQSRHRLNEILVRTAIYLTDKMQSGIACILTRKKKLLYLVECVKEL